MMDGRIAEPMGTPNHPAFLYSTIPFF